MNAERVDKTQKRAVFFSIIYFSEEFREVFLEVNFVLLRIIFNIVFIYLSLWCVVCYVYIWIDVAVKL